MIIRQARKEEASAIARLIMIAMNYDCCKNFAGEHHSLQDFEDMMTHLVAQEHSQYSYLNTIVAEEDGDVVGICTSYDGGRLHELRRAFIKAAKEYLERDFSGMDDETQAGELYIDSLAVSADYRHRGIATMLLKALIRQHKPLGLLVDEGNPKAERLYASLGFKFANYTSWGGHGMKHLVMAE
jgi:ribosomal protein S18 acetylase RimI-like enzyme